MKKRTGLLLAWTLLALGILQVSCSSRDELSKTTPEAPPTNTEFKEGEVIKFKTTGEKGVITFKWRNSSEPYTVRYRTQEGFKTNNFKEFELEKDDAKPDTKTN